MTRDDLQLKVEYNSRRINEILERLWQLENPPRFKVGDVIWFKFKESDYAYVDATVVKVICNVESECYIYHLWIPSYKLLYEYWDGDDNSDVGEYAKLKGEE